MKQSNPRESQIKNFYEQLKTLTDSYQSSEEKSEEPAATLQESQLRNFLNFCLKDYAAMIIPKGVSNSPFYCLTSAASKQGALQLFNTIKTKYIGNTGFTKPLVLIFPVLNNEKSPQTWFSCTILPKTYQNSFGATINNQKVMIFYSDTDSNPEVTQVPKHFQHFYDLLTKGTTIHQQSTTQRMVLTPTGPRKAKQVSTQTIAPCFPDAGFNNTSHKVTVNADDGFIWPVFDAIMTISTGNSEYVRGLRQPNLARPISTSSLSSMNSSLSEASIHSSVSSNTSNVSAKKLGITESSSALSDPSSIAGSDYSSRSSTSISSSSRTSQDFQSDDEEVLPDLIEEKSTGDEESNLTVRLRKIIYACLQEPQASPEQNKSEAGNTQTTFDTERVARSFKTYIEWVQAFLEKIKNIKSNNAQLHPQIIEHINILFKHKELKKTLPGVTIIGDSNQGKKAEHKESEASTVKIEIKADDIEQIEKWLKYYTEEERRIFSLEYPLEFCIVQLGNGLLDKESCQLLLELAESPDTLLKHLQTQCSTVIKSNQAWKKAIEKYKTEFNHDWEPYLTHELEKLALFTFELSPPSWGADIFVLLSEPLITRIANNPTANQGKALIQPKLQYALSTLKSSLETLKCESLAKRITVDADLLTQKNALQFFKAAGATAGAGYVYFWGFNEMVRIAGASKLAQVLTDKYTSDVVNEEKACVEKHSSLPQHKQTRSFILLCLMGAFLLLYMIDLARKQFQEPESFFGHSMGGP